MTELDNDLLAFKEYQKKLSRHSLSVVIGSLVYRLVSEGGITSPSGGTTTGGATEARQIESNQKLEDIKNAIAPTTAPAVPGLQIVNNTGATPVSNTITDAKHVSILIKSGTGTVLGQPVDTITAVIEFPLLERGWGDIDYTVNPGSTFVVLTGR